MTKTLYILGAGGHGKVVYDCALSMKEWDQIFFLDDEQKEVLNQKVFGGISQTEQLISEDTEFFVAIGNNILRKKMMDDLEKKEANIATIIHKQSIVSRYTKIEVGSVIMPGAIVNCSSNIGKGCIINSNSVVEHDVILEDFIHLAPNTTVSGNVHISKNVWIGAGATLINSIWVKENTIIGAGAIVINNLNHSGTYVGAPAKQIK